MSSSRLGALEEERANVSVPDTVPYEMEREVEQDPNGKSAHEAGSKLDDGKNRLGLVLGAFSQALWRVGEIGTKGAAKYTDNGWLLVPDGIPRYLDAVLRHLFKYFRGEKVDPDSGQPHLAHAAWGMLAVLELSERQEEDATADTSKGRPEIVVTDEAEGEDSGTPTGGYEVHLQKLAELLKEDATTDTSKGRPGIVVTDEADDEYIGTPTGDFEIHIFSSKGVRLSVRFADSLMAAETVGNKELRDLMYADGSHYSILRVIKKSNDPHKSVIRDFEEGEEV